MKSRIRLLALGFLYLPLNGCQTVKPYQTQYLKDHNMQTNSLPVEKLEAEAETYREGASGGMGGKTGGGCGCN